MDRIALQILEDGWEQDARVMRRAARCSSPRKGSRTRLRSGELAMPTAWI